MELLCFCFLFFLQDKQDLHKHGQEWTQVDRDKLWELAEQNTMLSLSNFGRQFQKQFQRTPTAIANKLRQLKKKSRAASETANAV